MLVSMGVWGVLRLAGFGGHCSLWIPGFALDLGCSTVVGAVVDRIDMVEVEGIVGIEPAVPPQHLDPPSPETLQPQMEVIVVSPFVDFVVH